MIKPTILVCSVFLLAACASEEQQRQQALAYDAEQDATCRNWGAEKGTPQYTQCRLQLADMDQRRRLAAAQMIMNTNQNLYNQQMQAIRARQQNEMSCTSYRSGNTVQTNCR